MQVNKLVINIIGFPACGKSSVCQQLEIEGFEAFRPSNILRQYAEEQGVELSGRQDYVDLHQRLNKARPYAIVEPVIESEFLKICIDGLRSPFLLDKLQSEITKVITIALDCPIEIRFQRVEADDQRRGTHRAPASLGAFEADELPDYQNPDRNLPNMQEMMARADYHIDATQSPTQIKDSLDVIISSLMPSNT